MIEVSEDNFKVCEVFSVVSAIVCFHCWVLTKKEFGFGWLTGYSRPAVSNLTFYNLYCSKLMCMCHAVLFFQSSSSPLSQTSPLPNGLLPSSGQLLKGVPLNHMAAAAGAMAVSPASNCSTPSPAPLDAAAPQQIQAHTKTPSGNTPVS